MFSYLKDELERLIRWLVVFITNYLPVKVIRDDKGVPFLYRYHLFTLGNNGPGMCIHRFIKSDPERGYHDHPWEKAVSFILCGGYKERILISSGQDGQGYREDKRTRWTFNFLNGKDVFHRVMIDEGKDAWTLFAFQKRSKTWGMISLDGTYKVMSDTITDKDGGWWNRVYKGLGLHTRLDNIGKVTATVDIIVTAENKVLLIKRGKEPFKNKWAFPGGRIEQIDKDILSAAYRELKEETNLSDIPLTFAKTIGNSHRDPRGFCITNVFVARLDKLPEKVRAGDDAVDYEWFDLKMLPEMAFDHKDILTEVLEL